MSIDIEHTSGIDVVSTTAQNIPQRYTLHLPPFRFSHTKHSSGIPSKGHVGFTNLHSPRNSRPSMCPFAKNTNYTKTTGSPQETTKLKVMHYFASLFCATAVEPLSTACILLPTGKLGFKPPEALPDTAPDMFPIKLGTNLDPADQHNHLHFHNNPDSILDKNQDSQTVDHLLVAVCFLYSVCLEGPEPLRNLLQHVLVTLD